jgi:hypothetical protein
MSQFDKILAKSDFVSITDSYTQLDCNQQNQNSVHKQTLNPLAV